MGRNAKQLGGKSGEQHSDRRPPKNRSSGRKTSNTDELRTEKYASKLPQKIQTTEYLLKTDLRAAKGP